MRKLAALFLLLAAAPAGATVLVSTQTSAPVVATVGYSSFSLTLPSLAANRGVVVGCEVNAIPPQAISSMTLNGVHISRQHTIANGLDRAEIWVGTGAIAGQNTIVAYLPGSYTGAVTLCGGVGVENLNQSTPVLESTGSFTGSVSWSVSGSSTLLVDVLGQGTDSNLKEPNSGQTFRWGAQNASRFTSAMGSTKDGGPASGTKTMGWVIGSAAPGAMSAVALQSASGAPEISSATPATRAIGQGAFTLTVTGSGFVSGSSVTWNGERRATTFVNSSQVTATILSTDTVNVGVVELRVVNPNNARTAAVSYPVTGDITKVWVGDGGFKQPREDLYGTECPTCTITRLWDGDTARPFQMKNEVNGFVLFLENGSNVNTVATVSYPRLTHESGNYVISSTPTSAANLYDWTQRPIQLYYVRYLPIQGVSRLNQEHYDETHLAEGYRATYTVNGNGQGIRTGNFLSRPNANKNIPDILIPLEAVTGSTFTVASSSSQAIWVDVYVPKDAPAGKYSGTISVLEGSPPQVSTTIPVNLLVYNATMPDVPPSKPYMYVSHGHYNERMGSVAYPSYTGITSTQAVVRLNLYKEIWRHGITTIGDAGIAGGGCSSIQNGPCEEFEKQLDGTLFTSAYGYGMAPGVGTPVPIYSMYTYGSWRSTAWWDETQEDFCENGQIWVNKFMERWPKADFFLYGEDEAADQTNNSTWATYIANCPYPANLLNLYATVAPTRVDTEYPNIDYASTTQQLGIAADQEAALRVFRRDRNRRLHYYNGSRPWTGTLMTDDDGISPRAIMWTVYKKKFDAYFQWEATNYTHGSNVDNDLFNDALTFGFYSSDDPTYGRTGFQYINGDGVLIYPGTDHLFPADSYGVNVPFPAWRLKMLRRGINDHTYLTMANKIAQADTAAIVQQIVPRVLWEYGVFEVADPTYQYGPASWPTNPNTWELAREDLAEIISRHR